jgi:hypothetical protein
MNVKCLFRWLESLKDIFVTVGQQGCQMVCFQTKNPNLGKFWRALHTLKIGYIGILCPFGQFYADLGYFMTIWYILYSFCTFFPVLVSCTKKNLATLPDRPQADTSNSQAVNIAGI